MNYVDKVQWYFIMPMDDKNTIQLPEGVRMDSFGGNTFGLADGWHLAGTIYWDGNYSIEFSGDYYALRLDANGRVETWYRRHNNLLGKWIHLRVNELRSERIVKH